MAIVDRINKIKNYFFEFNIQIENEASYVIVRFPDKWTLPDQNSLMEVYKTQVSLQREGVYFITEINNDPEILFDCIDYVIDFNNEVDARKELLSQKASELSSLFATEPLEKLRLLEFTFGKSKKRTGKSQPKKEETEQEKNVTGAEPIVEVKMEEAKKEEHKEAGTTMETGEDTDLMSFAKTLTGE